MKQDHTGPWLMSVNMFNPHPPFDNINEYHDWYDPDENAHAAVQGIRY
jgi:hypothetical protein